MIYILIILDILITNYTRFNTYFFITFLYHKSYKYYLLTGLILDLLIFNTFYNTITLTILYLVNKLFNYLNYQNFFSYLFVITINYVLYIIISNSLVFNNIQSIIFNIGYNLIINFIFYVLYYKRNNILVH